MARRRTRRGMVSDFDEAVGLGRVRDQDGGEYPFHCTAVADGSRTIPVGTEVAFVVVPARIGGLEADSLVPVR